MLEVSTPKAAWGKVAFGDVVRLSTERSRDPADDGFQRFVGLDHIDPGDLRIRRWGDVADGTTFTSVFRPGQVLFGKRRAYQRKVAVADFAGVCSGDIYVFEPKGTNLLPELLPFICRMESFIEHAVGTSAGSLSPRTNWRSLSTFEFRLPPIEEQRRLVVALESARRLVQTLTDARNQLDVVLDSFARDTFQEFASAYPMVPVTRLGQAVMGRQKAPKFQRGISPRPYLRVANVGKLELLLSELEEMDFSDSELNRFRLIPGDIVLTEGDLISEMNVGRPAMFRGEVDNCCFQNTLIRFRPNLDIPPFFALLLLEGARLSGVFAATAKKTTVTHLGLGRFKEVLLPLPPAGVREDFAQRLEVLLEGRCELRDRLAQAHDLNHQVLQGAFS